MALHMSLIAVLPYESFVAQGTCEGFFPTVNAEMYGQVVVGHEGLAADGTRVCLVPGVSPDVCLQSGVNLECQRAVRAQERSHIRVTGHVPAEGLARDEALVAHAALVWPVVHVCHHVYFQVGSYAAALPTNVTHERLCAIVVPEMCHQRGFPREVFSANGTGVGSLGRVHYQVGLEVCLECKCLATDGAHVVSLRRVGQAVCLKVGRAHKPSATCAATERSFILVRPHVET